MNPITNIHIRDANIEDAEDIARLQTEFTTFETTPTETANRMHNAKGIEYPIVAEVEGKVVGFASLRLHPYLGEDAPYAELSELFVTEAYRRRGIAKALYSKVEEMAQEGGASSIAVLTDSNNLPALRFYQEMGLETFSIALQKWFGGENPYSHNYKESNG